MIIIALYQNGVAEIVSPSRIFQGTDSEQIVVLSPYPYTVPLQISYTSPKGVNNGYVPMQPIDLPSDYTTVSAWQYSPGSSWTQHYGTAYINLLVNLPTETSGTYGQLTTFMCQITIEQSILPTLPPTPTQDVYDQILEYLGAYADLNERINNLEQAEVTGVKGNAETTYRTGNVNITPANIGLGNVDNTSDQDKPVSTAQQEALTALQQEVESYADTAAENAQSAAVNTANEYTDGQISSLQTTLEDYTDTQVASGVTEAVQQAKEYTDDQFGIKVGTTVTVGGLAQSTVDLDTAMVRGVIATQLFNQNIDTFVGENYWGKVFYISGGSSVTGLPQNTNGGTLEVLRGGGQTTVHRYTATTDTSGESVAPNTLQRQYISSWSNWEELVSADGSYQTLGAGYLATQIKVTASSSSLIGWNQFAEIEYTSLNTNYSYSAILLVNGVHGTQSTSNVNLSETGIIEVDFYKEASANPIQLSITVLCGNININETCAVLDTTNSKIYLYSYFNLYQSIAYILYSQEQGFLSSPATLSFVTSYYGSTAPDGAVYAVLRNNASSADIATTLTEPFAVGKDTSADTTGYVKFASVSLPAAYRSASARFEVLDKNPVNAQTNMCGVEVVVKNTSESNVTVTAQLLYGSSAYLSKIYACIQKGEYPVIVDLYFDITSSNPQESIACIKPLFTFTRATGITTFTFISDNELVSALPTDTTNTQLSTIYTPVTEAKTATDATNVTTNINGKAISSIFESDGVTVKNSTTVNGVNVYTSFSQLGLSGSFTDKDVVEAMANDSVFLDYVSRTTNNTNIYKDIGSFFWAIKTDYSDSNNMTVLAWSDSFNDDGSFNWTFTENKHDSTYNITETPINITALFPVQRVIGHWRLTFSGNVNISVPQISTSVPFSKVCTPLTAIGFIPVAPTPSIAVRGTIVANSEETLQISKGQSIELFGYYNPSGAWEVKVQIPDWFSVQYDAGICALGVFGECRQNDVYKISAVVPQNETSANVTVYIKQIS